MDYQTIDEIYAVNDRIRDHLAEMINGINVEELKTLPDGEKWSVEQIIEHVTIVEDGMFRICRKLLTQAQESGIKASGEIQISDAFRSYSENIDTAKLEAPERVWPTGERSVEECQAKMNENKTAFETLLSLFKEFDGIELKFSHPYFGPLSAQEWLVLAGEHMRRHTRQIEKLVEKIRQ
jgi:hypothetical protein